MHSVHFPTHYLAILREAAKYVIFLVAWPLRPYPLELSGHKSFSRFFLELQKRYTF